LLFSLTSVIIAALVIMAVVTPVAPPLNDNDNLAAASPQTDRAVGETYTFESVKTTKQGASVLLTSENTSDQRVVLTNHSIYRANEKQNWIMVKQDRLPQVEYGDNRELGPYVLLGNVTMTNTTINGDSLTIVVPGDSRYGTGNWHVNGEYFATQLREDMTPYDLSMWTDTHTVLFAIERNTHPTADSAGVMYRSDEGYVVPNKIYTTTDNTWIHEYIHAQQNFNLAPQMWWFTEGSAEYLTHRIMQEQSPITEQSVRASLSMQDQYDGTALAEPSDWAGGKAQTEYTAGPRLLYRIDEQIRSGSNGRYTLVDVFKMMNGDRSQVTLTRFIELVESFSREDASWIRGAVHQLDDRQKFVSETPITAFEPSPVAVDCSEYEDSSVSVHSELNHYKFTLMGGPDDSINQTEYVREYRDLKRVVLVCNAKK
jgi:hypothetical protein